MICVVATLSLTPGRRDDFLTIFHQLVPKVQAEQGCIEYAPMVDVPTSLGAQGEVRDDAVTVVEKWESVEALEAHLIIEHMNEFRAAAKDLLQGMALQILEPA